jgi:hypothetical protein
MPIPLSSIKFNNQTNNLTLNVTVREGLDHSIQSTDCDEYIRQLNSSGGHHPSSQMLLAYKFNQQQKEKNINLTKKIYMGPCFHPATESNLDQSEHQDIFPLSDFTSYLKLVKEQLGQKSPPPPIRIMFPFAKNAHITGLVIDFNTADDVELLFFDPMGHESSYKGQVKKAVTELGLKITADYQSKLKYQQDFTYCGDWTQLFFNQVVSRVKTNTSELYSLREIGAGEMLKTMFSKVDAENSRLEFISARRNENIKKITDLKSKLEDTKLLQEQKNISENPGLVAFSQKINALLDGKTFSDDSTKKEHCEKIISIYLSLSETDPKARESFTKYISRKILPSLENFSKKQIDEYEPSFSKFRRAEENKQEFARWFFKLCYKTIKDKHKAPDRELIKKIQDYSFYNYNEKINLDENKREMQGEFNNLTTDLIIEKIDKFLNYHDEKQRQEKSREQPESSALRSPTPSPANLTLRAKSILHTPAPPTPSATASATASAAPDEKIRTKQKRQKSILNSFSKKQEESPSANMITVLDSINKNYQEEQKVIRESVQTKKQNIDTFKLFEPKTDTTDKKLICTISENKSTKEIEAEFTNNTEKHHVENFLNGLIDSGHSEIEFDTDDPEEAKMMSEIMDSEEFKAKIAGKNVEIKSGKKYLEILNKQKESSDSTDELKVSLRKKGP